MNAENILEVKDLQTTFKLYEGMLRAVNHVDLTLRTGKTLGIIGESGCGKSVTAHSILNTVQLPGKVEGGTVMYRTRSGQEVNLAAQGQNSKFIRSIRGRDRPRRRNGFRSDFRRCALRGGRVHKSGILRLPGPVRRVNRNKG